MVTIMIIIIGEIFLYDFYVIFCSCCLRCCTLSCCFFLHKSLLLFFVASCLDRLVAVFGPVGSSASNDHRIASIYPTLVNIIHSWHSNSPKDPRDQLPLPCRKPHQPFLYTYTCFTAPKDDGRVKLVFCTI